MARKVKLAACIQVWLITFFHCIPVLADPGCGDSGTWLQVLGSGEPELDDGRSSTGYLVWQAGKAKILVDIGSGSMHRFEQSGAALNDLDAVLLSHLHVDHSSDLPALVKASFFSGRNRDLPVYGPSGNNFMPATTVFLNKLFGANGAYPYLSSYLEGGDDYQLLPRNIDANSDVEQQIGVLAGITLAAIPVRHGPIPALAWRVEIEGKIVVFSGDMSNEKETLVKLAGQADLLVAHHAIQEHSGRIARNLHMPPSVIGKIAVKAQAGQLLLSHYMNRSLAEKETSTEEIRAHFPGPIIFAEDLQCIELR